MKALDDFYFKKEEPLQGCLLALKTIILSQDDDIEETCKYGLPFFCYKGKMFCYLWFHKKYKQPYIGIVEGHRLSEEFLLAEKRSRMKIMLIDQNGDLPIESITLVLQKALSFYKTGVIKVKEK